MKRQHPDDPNLFWCPKCQMYKAREEFSPDKRVLSGIQNICKECKNKKIRTKYHHNIESERNKNREKARVYREKPGKREMLSKRSLEHYYRHRIEIIKLVKVRVKAWKKKNPEHKKKLDANYKKRCVKELRDNYVVGNMKRDGIPITPETIELKRQQIIMKRTLKQLKDWRKEHESNYSDVQGQQRPDEKDYVGEICSG